MAKPWEKYQKQKAVSTPQTKSGPWEKYAKPQEQTQEQPKGIFQQVGDVAKQGVQAGMTGPFTLTKKLADETAKNPEAMFERSHSAYPILGGLLAGGPGASAGEALRIGVGNAIGSKSVPTSSLGIFANVVGQGVMMNPKMVTAIPGVPKVAEAAGDVAKWGGNKAKKLISATTGLKEGDIAQGFKQGYNTYLAPSMEKAKDTFRAALEKAGISGKLPPKQVFDPQLENARKVATEAAEIVEKGGQLTAEEALNARQATDMLFERAKIYERSARAQIAQWRTRFDDILSGLSGDLKNASTGYRQAIVKDKLLEPFKLNKSGTNSAIIPMGSAVLGGAAGMMPEKYRNRGIGSALIPLAATSPLLHGAAVTTAGTVAKMATNPQVRQGITNLISALIQRRVARDKKQ